MSHIKHTLHMEQPIGVASVFDDTLTLAVIASKEPKGKVLDVGTGTGYIAIYLAKLGFDADGVDINKSAIYTAKINAKKNHVSCHFFISDLFSEVKSKYNIIVFNPPLGNEGGNKVFEIIKSVIRKSKILIKISEPVALRLFKKNRISILTGFFSNVDKLIKKNGKVLVLVNNVEINWYKNLIPDIFQIEKIKSPISGDDHVVLRLSIKKSI